MGPPGAHLAAGVGQDDHSLAANLRGPPRIHVDFGSIGPHEDSLPTQACQAPGSPTRRCPASRHRIRALSSLARPSRPKWTTGGPINVLEDSLATAAILPGASRSCFGGLPTQARRNVPSRGHLAPPGKYLPFTAGAVQPNTLIGQLFDPKNCCSGVSGRHSVRR